MNKVQSSIAITATLVVTSGLALALYESNRAEMRESRATTKPAVSEQKVTQPTAKSSPAPIMPGKYIAYDPTTFNQTTGSRLLFFHAPWCPQCQDLDKSIVAQSKLADNTTIFKVDYDTQNDLRVKYGVTLQTTIVKVDAAGNKLDSFVAYQDPSYESVAKHYALQ